MCSMAEIHGTKGGIGLYHVSTLRYCDLSSSPEIHETLRMTIGIVPCSVQLACGMAEHGSVSLFLHICVWGSCFWLGTPGLAPPPSSSSSSSQPALTHNLLTHTTYSHTTSSHTTYSHTTFSYNLLTYSHTTYSHTTSSHRTYPHTTYSHNFHKQLSPYNLLPKTSSSTTSSHTAYSHTQLTHTQLPHTHLSHTHFFGPSLTVYALRHGPFEVESYSRTSGESNHHWQSVSDTRVTPYQLSHEDDYTFLRASYAHTTSSHTTF